VIEPNFIAILDGAMMLHEPALSIVSAPHEACTYAMSDKEVGGITTQPLVEYVPAWAQKVSVSFVVKGVPVKLTEA